MIIPPGTHSAASNCAIMCNFMSKVRIHDIALKHNQFKLITGSISKDVRLLAICLSFGFNGTIDSSGISWRSSPLTPNHLTLQADAQKYDENEITT